MGDLRRALVRTPTPRRSPLVLRVGWKYPPPHALPVKLLFTPAVVSHRGDAHALRPPRAGPPHPVAGRARRGGRRRRRHGTRVPRRRAGRVRIGRRLDHQLRRVGRPAAGRLPAPQRHRHQQDHRAPHGVPERHRLLAGPGREAGPGLPEPAHGRQRLVRHRPALHRQPGRARAGGPARQPRAAGRRRPAGDLGALPRENGRAIGIENEGTYVTETPPQELLDSLVQLCATVGRRYGLHAHDIFGHWDFRTTACPGAAFYRQFPELRRRVFRELGTSIGDVPARRWPDLWRFVNPPPCGWRSTCSPTAATSCR